MVPGMFEAIKQAEGVQGRSAVIGKAAALYEKETGSKPDLFGQDFQSYVLRVQDDG